jgi:DNA-binding CsgD family transcriptional regulator
LLFQAAKLLEPLDPELARETHLDALGAAIFAGRLGGEPGSVAMARAALAAPPGPEPPRAVDLLLDGLACRLSEGYVAGLVPLRRALAAVQREEDVRWHWLACRIASEVWDDEAWEQLTAEHVRVSRDTAALAVLPLALTYRSGTHLHAGEFSATEALIDEATALNRSIGGPPLMYTQILLAAWRGQRAETARLLDRGVPDAIERGEGRGLTWVEYGTAVLHNGLGDYEAARVAAAAACEHDDLGLVAWALIELVEAAARCERADVAVPALERLVERTQAGGTDWALGVEARSRALLSDGDEAEALYEEAVERLGRTRLRVHLARTHLVFGEWLRRAQRRSDAREHLRAAHEMLDRSGAGGFAERARRELSATGEAVRRRDAAPAVLTPQEAQVARLAAEGHTNPEIGAQLFISPRTAEYHLRKVFTKLAVTSRHKLPGALDRLEGAPG